MGTVLFVILFLGWVGWIGCNEMPFCFIGIRRSGILRSRVFRLCMLLASALGALYLLCAETGTYFCRLEQVLAVTVSVMLTLCLLRCLGGTGSSVTALFGAWAAVSFFNDGELAGYPFLEVSLSMFAAPLAGGLLACGLNCLVRRCMSEDTSHLLVKGLYVKWGLIAGIVVCGALLCCNYAAFLSPMFLAVTDATLGGMAAGGIALLAVLVWFASLFVPGTGIASEHVKESHLIASLYALALVLAGFHFGHLFFGFSPIIVAPLPVMMAEILFLRKDKIQKSLVSLLVGVVFCPAVAFLICAGLLNLSGEQYLSMFFVIALSGGCLLLRGVFRQRHRHVMVKQALEEERIRRSEACNELNRLDMASVTSQFDELSNRMEMKRRELVNLALHIRQQRDYVEELCSRLESVAALEDGGEMRAQLKGEIVEMRESMKFSQEMNRFYAQVDAVHKSFTSKLMMRCPNLTEQEKRLAILLRLGFSSKEMATLLNITPKSVEISRYRFRKKLKLERDENLVQYIQLL